MKSLTSCLRSILCVRPIWSRTLIMEESLSSVDSSKIYSWARKHLNARMKNKKNMVDAGFAAERRRMRHADLLQTSFEPMDVGHEMCWATQFRSLFACLKNVERGGYDLKQNLTTLQCTMQSLLCLLLYNSTTWRKRF